MTLVELMVALLLGLVTTYFIAQVFAVAEGQKRTATFGSDAQVNGAVALHTLSRHVQASGYGVTSVTEGLGCAIKGEFGTAGTTAPAPAMNLAPIVISPSAAASAPSDTVTVLIEFQVHLRNAGLRVGDASEQHELLSRCVRRSASRSGT